MTVLDDRPATEQAAPPGPPRNSRQGSTASWRFASRLARREVRRRPGRTILVTLLIAIPVVAMALGSIMMRTGREGPESSFARRYGSADFVVQVQNSALGLADPDAVFGPDAPALPAGSRTASFASAYTTVNADIDGTVTSTYVELSDIDLTGPVVGSTVDVQRGRIPETASEVLFSDDVADRFGVDVGDTIRFVRPDLDLQVVGIGRHVAYHSDSLMIVPGFDRSLFRPGGSVQYTTAIDLPDNMSAGQVAAVADRFATAGSADDKPFYVERANPTGVDFAYQSDDTVRNLAWGWVAGVVGFVAVGIIIAAAFATSARRQLVTIGQLSANGASERLVRRTMGMQGMWTGALGGVLGLALAIAGSIVAYRTGLVERLVNHDVDGLRVNPVDLAVIWTTAVFAATVAALIPARSASRIPVLSALAGRRPVATPPRWMAPAGVALFLGGLFLLAGAAGTTDGGDFAAMLAVVGSLGVLFGIVCASPLIVSAVGKVGARGGGVVRLASRSLDRARARSAAVLTAIAVVGALAVAGATAAGTAENADNSGGYVPDLDRVSLVFQGNRFDDVEQSGDADGVVDPPPAVPTPLPIDLRQGIEKILPDATWTSVTTVIDDPLPYRADTGEEILPAGIDPIVSRLNGLVVVDDAVADFFDLSSEQQRILDETGVIALSPWYGTRGLVQAAGGYVEVDLTESMTAMGFDGEIDTETEQQRANEFNDVENRLGSLGGLVVSPTFVEANGLTTGVTQYIVDNPVDLTSAQRDDVRDLQPGYYADGGGDAFVAQASAPGYTDLGEPSDSTWWVSVDSPNTSVPWALIQAIVALASLLMVLMVVAIGLSLAATESRDERDVLHAVGASPRTLRRVAATKAWVLATGAAVVAVPAGYVTMFVITRATDSTAPVPFAVIGALLVVIPLLAGGATLAVSSIAQRVKPVTYSTFAAE